MPTPAKARRAALRDALIDIAERHVSQSGLANLRARALANEAGCAVGAIYNVFDGLDGLVLEVNGQTFRRLGQMVSGAVERQASAPPVERLVTMAKAYLAFAQTDPNLWRALFDVEMSTDSDVPEWYLTELSRLFAIIAGPLSEIDPSASPSEINLRTRALFSAVHGIVLLGQERRISAVPEDAMITMLDFVVRGAARA